MVRKIQNSIHSICLELRWFFTGKPSARLSGNEAGTRFLILSGGGVRVTERKSFGEEMMLLSICNHIRQVNPEASVTVLRYLGTSGEEYDFYGHRIREVSFPSENYLSLSSYKEFRKIASGFSDVYLIGADCLDGAYWRRQTIQMLRFMILAGVAGCRGRILGFSYNGSKDAVIRRELNKASSYCTLCARDHISHRRLSEFVSKSPVIVTDLAFLVDASAFPIPDSDVSIHQTLENWKKEGATLVAVNICGWHWENPEVYVNRISIYIFALAKRNPMIRFLLLAHDNREGRISDGHALSLLSDQLDIFRDRVMLCNSLQSGIQAKQLVRRADVLLTGRMHLGIAALSQGIPTVSLMYQGKFEGLYDHYKFDRTYYFEPDDLENVFNALEDVLANKAILSQHIQSRNEEIFRLAEKNF